MPETLWTADEIAKAVGGQVAGDFAATGVSIDTRSVEKGDLFVPLVGARDGHDFVPQAVANGAAGVLAARPVDAPAVMVSCTPSPPIGSRVEADHLDTTFELVPGATVGFYTDGLVERRDVPIDDGVERLRRSFFAGPPEEVCRQVMGDLIGATAVHDDTALLVVSRTG